MTKQDNAKWQELLSNEYFNQDEFLAEYTEVKKHPTFNSHYGDCPYCKCSGTFTAKHVENELLVQCTGMHQRKKTPCMMCGNLCDMLILLDNCSMEEALAKIEAWVHKRIPFDPEKHVIVINGKQCVPCHDGGFHAYSSGKEQPATLRYTVLDDQGNPTEEEIRVNDTTEQPVDIEEMAAQKGDWVQNLLPKGKKRRKNKQ